MVHIPLHDVIEQNNSVRAELDAAIAQVLDSGTFIRSEEVATLENAFANYVGMENCLGVGNATDGFELVFSALGFEEGDEIIIPANAHVSPALAVLKCGLNPVFCDVDENRALLNAATVSEQISAKTKAIVAVHLHGRVCPMDELQDLCKGHDLVLIEDFSQAHGATFNSKKVGSFGDVSVCSFYPTKPLGALGDGGAILTSNYELAEKCTSLANYGWKSRDNSAFLGQNSRLDELQAAVLNVKLKHFESWNDERVSRAKKLSSEIKKMGIETIDLAEGDVCHLFVLRSEKRDEIQNVLGQKGIESQVHYPIPIHKQGLFSQDVEFPNAERLCQEVLSVPVNDKILKALAGFN